MVIVNKELTQLCKQQHNLIRELNNRKDKDKERQLLEINELIRTKQRNILDRFWEQYNITQKEVKYQDKFKPENFKRNINRQYKEMIELYRDVMTLAQDISKYKKVIRDNIL